MRGKTLTSAALWAAAASAASHPMRTPAPEPAAAATATEKVTAVTSCHLHGAAELYVPRLGNAPCWVSNADELSGTVCMELPNISCRPRRRRPPTCRPALQDVTTTKRICKYIDPLLVKTKSVQLIRLQGTALRQMATKSSPRARKRQQATRTTLVTLVATSTVTPTPVSSMYNLVPFFFPGS